jgi:hypothetical protein
LSNIPICCDSSQITQQHGDKAYQGVYTIP